LRVRPPMVDDRTLSALEYDALKRLVAPFLRTDMGRRALRDLCPSADPVEVRSRKELSREAMRHHLDGGRLGPGSVEDPEPAVERLRPAGSILEPGEILKVAGAAQAADSLRRDLQAARERYPLLWEVASRIPDLREVTKRISGKIAPTGDLEDSASPQLEGLRRRILVMEARLQKDLHALLDSSAARGLLQEAYVTIRNGRFVIPVRAEARSSVPGIVHGSSGTGATVFVEPMQTIELNNEMVTLRDEEAAEVRRILSEWTEMLRQRLPEIEAACLGLARLDLIGAIAVFGVSFRCAVAVEPRQGRDGEAGESLLLSDARHPILEAGLSAKEEVAVPLTISMQATGGALVLSGPNAGGKTVALKTIGLLALMNQSGLPVPARDAVLPVYRQVLADIGDHQSILESLSTFSARLVRVAEMTRSLDPPALVLLDEVGAGTDPEEAGALAVAIVDHFRRRGASVVATTHHEPLKSYAQATSGALNASMEIDEATMRPTYKLVEGVAGRSGGVDLAERIGLPAELIADARGRLSSGHREARQHMARLQELVEAKAREEELLRLERERLQKERVEQERAVSATVTSLRESWRQAVDQALARMDRAREDLLSSIKERAIALQLRSEARRQSRTLREQLEGALSGPEGGAGASSAGGVAPDRAVSTIKPGARVRVEGVGGRGETATVETVDARGRAAISMRGKRVSVRLGDLKLAEPEPSAPRKTGPPIPAGVRFDAGKKVAAASEIVLIGEKVEEALGRLDKFLDDAYLAGHREVRIVHGHGTGRLRSAVREMLSGHPHVESHAVADERSGGTGATVAVLRA